MHNLISQVEDKSLPRQEQLVCGFFLTKDRYFSCSSLVLVCEEFRKIKFTRIIVCLI